MSIKNNLVTGLVSGIFAPLIAFVIYSKIKFPEEPLQTIFNHIKSLGILSSMISLSVFINLLVFFLFIWTKSERSARGVLAATFVYAFTVAVLKLSK
jgi:hypothetical protein